MNPIPTTAVLRCAVILATTVFWQACDKPAEPPKAVAIEKAPEGLKEAFKETPKQTRSPENAAVKQQVNEASAALQTQDYSRALVLLESLSGRSDLTRDQREFVTSSMMAAHKALSTAASSGNADAAKALEFRRATK